MSMLTPLGMDIMPRGKHIPSMNTLSLSRRAAVVRGLVEGGSIRAVARMTGTNKDTVMRIVSEVGEFCAIYQSVK